jgi:hypothetical protein
MVGKSGRTTIEVAHIVGKQNVGSWDPFSDYNSEHMQNEQ